MNLRLIIKILGQILVFASFSMVVALPWTLGEGEEGKECLKAFFKSMLVGIALGGGLWALGRRASREFFRREGLATVALAWLLIAGIGALPFYFSGFFPGNYLDCYFEAMSGFTTTGATVLDNIEQIPKSLLFWRAFTQWLGGMGIIVLFISIFPALGIEAKLLYQVEVPGIEKKGIMPRIRDTAGILWRIYLCFTVWEIFLLLLGGVSFFDACAHTFTTLATGGFSTYTASISGFNSLYVELVIIFFMFLVGVNFSLYAQTFQGNPKALWKNREFLAYLLLLCGAVFLLWLSLIGFNDHCWGLKALREAGFQAVSIMTTTGYTTADFDRWNDFARFFLLGLMFIGGCTGSTGGSIKVMRILIAVKIAKIELKKFFFPRRVISLKLGKEPVEKEVISLVFGFIVLFIGAFIISTFALLAMGLDPITSMSATIACLGNIGPGLAKVGPTAHYFHLPYPAKALLSFLMVLGRLEVYPLLLLFLPGFWRK